MRMSRFMGMGFGKVKEMLRDGWREFVALEMYLKMFAPPWPTRSSLCRLGRQTLLLIPVALIFISSFAQVGADQNISFHLITLALIFAACIAVSWFLAGVSLGTLPASLKTVRLFSLAIFFSIAGISAFAQRHPTSKMALKRTAPMTAAIWTRSTPGMGT